MPVTWGANFRSLSAASSIAGNDANFNLNAPEIEPVNEEDVTAMIASDDYMGFELEDSPVLLGLHLES